MSYFLVSPKFCDLVSVFIKVEAITLYPFVISREPMDDITKNHEKIHLAQQAELLVLGFYLMYVWYWWRGMKKYEGSKRQEMLAYRNIPFEREAYQHQMDPRYPIKRKAYSWWSFR